MEHGTYHQLMRELELENAGDFVNYMRMEPQMFQELLLRVSPRITKEDTNYWQALSPGLKLAVTLRYYATGNFMFTVNFNLNLTFN